MNRFRGEGPRTPAAMNGAGDASAERQARRDIVAVCRRIYERGWITATDGNVSVLLGPDRVLCTPTAINKGTMTEADLIITDRQGNRITGTRKPSSELKMHLAAYDERPEVRAVVHAHPTNCIAFSLAGVSLAQCLLPEIVFTFGSIPTTAYTTPTTDEVPAEIRKWIHDFDAMILQRHGSLTVGADVHEAYDKLERMEHVAEITFRARQLGPIRPLAPEQVARLQAVGRSLGLPERKILGTPCDHCNACPGGGKDRAPVASAPPAPAVSAPPAPAVSIDDLVRRVSASVDAALGGRSR
ncbi:Ribulose-5-phosphate 4-epimerase [Minicystis rosea]|nr:Ribulose-5-phosphate 4-epimerase [Minicystis rosea]